MYSLKGFNENICTFEAEGNINPGQPVSLCDNYVVTASGENHDFHGIAVNCRNGAVAVQMTGYVEVACSGDIPGLGRNKLAADGNGNVVCSENGTSYLVVSADTQTGMIGIIL